MGTNYSNSSLKAVVNSGVSGSDSPGFGISSFSGLTPSNTKVITSFDIGRINTNTGMNFKAAVFEKHSLDAPVVLGVGETLKIAEDGRICFVGNATDKYIKNGKWEKFTIVLDTKDQKAYLYLNGELISIQSTGRITGIDGIDFDFFGTSGGQWYLDNLSVKTSEDMPNFDDDGDTLAQLYFDGLKSNEVYSADGLSYLNFKDETKDVFKMEAKSALFGKNADDVALAISNTSSSVSINKFSSGNDDERYHGLKLDLANIGIGTNDTVLFETEIAIESLNSTKAIKATAYTNKGTSGSLGNLISVPMNGHVEVLGTTLKDDSEFITVQPQKWYNVKVLMKRTVSGNKMDVYWDGRLVTKDADFRIDGNTTVAFAGIASVSAGYNISHMPITTSPKLADGNYSAYTADAMYLDNMVYSVYKNTQPSIDEVSVSSYDPYYFHTIDVSGANLYTYGQDVERFINKLNTKNVSSAEFISSDGMPISGKADDAAYLRLETNNSEHIYLKTKSGTDSYLLSLNNINNDNSWNKDLSGFYEYEQPDIAKLKGSALDASFVLDGPAGKYGFVQADADGFVCVDENGNKTPIQFWGTNIGGAGAFPDTHEEADKIADSVAAAGFNMVRFHNIDWASLPNVFGAVRVASGKKLDDTQMDKLCYLMYALKQRGIYFFVDQTVSRPIFADDNAPAGVTSTKGVAYFSDPVITALEGYSELLLNYKNPYTNLALKDDPAMALIDLNNENSLEYFDIRSLIGTLYYDDYKKQYNEWLVERYGTRDALVQAWKSEPNSYFANGLADNEDPTKGTVEVSTTSKGTITEGDTTKVMSIGRILDEKRFISYIYEKYFTRRINHLRNMGVKCAITGATSWGDLSTESWYPNYLSTDFIDTHGYWSHPSGGNNTLTGKGTRFNTNGTFKDAATGEGVSGVTSNLKADGLGLFGQLATGNTYGKPYTISEYKVCPGNMYLAEGPLLASAYGRLQGWNPIDFIFNAKTDINEQIKDGEKILLKDTFSTFENPTLRAIFPSAAVMFLRKDVTEATSGYYHNYSGSITDKSANTTEDNIWHYGPNSDYTAWPNNVTWADGHSFESMGNYALVGKTGVSFNTDLTSVNCEKVKSAADVATDGDKVYTSLTNELTTDLKNGIFKMNTKNSQALCGFIGGKTYVADNLSVNVSNEYAAVTLVSLDNNNIAGSGRMLLTMAGNSVNNGQILSDDGTTIQIAGKYPIMVEQIMGEVELKGLAGSAYEVYPLTSSGERKAPLAVARTEIGIKFTVDKNAKAMNFEIVKK